MFVLSKCFSTEFPGPANGELRPDLSRPGMGIELKKKDAERFAA